MTRSDEAAMESLSSLLKKGQGPRKLLQEY